MVLPHSPFRGGWALFGTPAGLLTVRHLIVQVSPHPVEGLWEGSLGPKICQVYAGVWPYVVHYSFFIVYRLEFIGGIFLDPALKFEKLAEG